MTEQDFIRAGVVFGQLNGQPTYSAPADVRDALLLEVAKRAETILTAPRPIAKRWGQCDTCGDPLESHRGGDCTLCVAARRKALRAKGLIK